MNFFENQERARKKTFLLVMLLLIAVLLIVLAINILIIVVFTLMHNEDLAHLTANIRRDEFISFCTNTAVIVTPVVLFVIFLGTIIKMFMLNNGGLSIAEMVKARPVDVNTDNLLEKRFINVVEEMAIASGISVPHLFVMENEKGINAFVAGYSPEDTVLVVTQGALEQLNRDELQGVIGHEFSHIFNSDMHINIKLIGIVSGIVMISQMGSFILRNMRFRSSSSNSKDDNKLQIVILISGIGLLVIGYIGLFFGRWIKAAISRERESLADATSVQYTRNPTGLIGALMRIQAYEQGTLLNSTSADDINHMCFGPSLEMLFSGLLASHPPIEERIQALDPQGYYAPNIKLTRDENVAKPSKAHRELNAKDLMIGTVVLANKIQQAQNVNLGEIKQSIGNPSLAHVDVAKQLLKQIPEPLNVVAHDPNKVKLLYFALMMPESEEQFQSATQLLSTLLPENEQQQVLQYSQIIHDLGKTVKLPLIDISLAAFKQISIEERKIIYQNLEKIALLDKENLFEFTLLSILSKATGVPKTKRRINNLTVSALLPQISALLFAVIKSGHSDPTLQVACYDKLMKEFTDLTIPLPKAEPLKLNFILSQLNHLTPLCKEQLINACLHCIEEDNIINVNEAELVRAIAARLDCPIPPIIPSQQSN